MLPALSETVCVLAASSGPQKVTCTYQGLKPILMMDPYLDWKPGTWTHQHNAVKGTKKERITLQ